MKWLVGALLSGDGQPISCQVYRGNQADVRSLPPVVDRARERFALREVCFLADRGMVSEEAIQGLEERKLGYILGMRLRQAKEVRVGDRRYIVGLNPEEGAKDKMDGELILEALEEKLSQGAKALVGNCWFRRYLQVEKNSVRIDPRKVEAEACYDGKRVLRTNTDLPAVEVVRDLVEVREVEVHHHGKDYILRSPLRGVSGKVFQAAGVAVPPPVREVLAHGAKA